MYRDGKGWPSNGSMAADAVSTPRMSTPVSMFKPFSMDTRSSVARLPAAPGRTGSRPARRPTRRTS